MSTHTPGQGDTKQSDALLGGSPNVDVIAEIKRLRALNATLKEVAAWANDSNRFLGRGDIKITEAEAAK